MRLPLEADDGRRTGDGAQVFADAEFTGLDEILPVSGSVAVSGRDADGAGAVRSLELNDFAALDFVAEEAHDDGFLARINLWTRPQSGNVS